MINRQWNEVPFLASPSRIDRPRLTTMLIWMSCSEDFRGLGCIAFETAAPMGDKHRLSGEYSSSGQHSTSSRRERAYHQGKSAILQEQIKSCRESGLLESGWVVIGSEPAWRCDKVEQTTKTAQPHVSIAAHRCGVSRSSSQSLITDWFVDFVCFNEADNEPPER